MNRKDIIISLSNRLKKRYEGKNPTEILSVFKSDSGIKTLSATLDAEEIVILIFLLSNNKIKNLSVLYDVISINLYGYTMIQILEDNPEIECDMCQSTGLENCRYCYGEGRIDCNQCYGSGETDCDYCGGDGETNRGETCDECQGGGNLECEDCLGEGSYSCNECEGHGDFECRYCDGMGSTTEFNKVRYEYKAILTYNPKIKKIIENEGDEKFTKMPSKFFESTAIESSEFDLILDIGDDITFEFFHMNYDIGDTYLTNLTEKNELNLETYIDSIGFKIESNNLKKLH